MNTSVNQLTTETVNFRKMTYADWKNLGDILDYKKCWAFYRWAECREVTPISNPEIADIARELDYSPAYVYGVLFNQ